MSNDIEKRWAGKIITISGETFDIQKPRPEMLDISDIAHALSMQCRYNGHVPTFYSVAEHSVRVAMRLELIGESAKVCLAGLLHDGAEAYIGDMVNPMKRIPDLGQLFKSYEEAIEYTIQERWGVPLVPMPTVVKEADEYVYAWEVEHIRTSNFAGWPNRYAFNQFINYFIKYGGHYGS